MNKDIKYIFLFTTLLLLVIGIGCVSAADTDNLEDITPTIDTANQIETTIHDNNIANENKELIKEEKKDIKTATAKNFTITDKSYSTYFDSDSIAKNDVIANNSNLILSGNIKNKDFTFDNIKLTVKNDGTSTVYNTTITVQNNAVITFDGLKVSNTNKGDDYTILLESEGNVIKNSIITIKSNTPVQAIKIDENKNKIINTTVNVKAPSSDVIYNADYSIGNAATSGIFIRSSDNIINKTKVTYDGKQQTGYFPSVDGIDIQSKAVGLLAENNIITNSQVIVTGSNYAYGINMGRSKNTKIENIKINVSSDYYSDAIQLFDADTTQISGKLYSKAVAESYGIYSTAMATGISKKITLKNVEITSESEKARAILIEGSNSTSISNSKLNVKGENATAIMGQIDWMNNIPNGLSVKNVTVNIEGNNEDNNIMGFYKCKNINITDSTIKATSGSRIVFLSTPNVKVENNYIEIGDKYTGDYAVSSDSTGATIKNNTPYTYIVTDKTYSTYFDKNSIAKNDVISDGSILIFSGNIKNKDFTFDDIEVSVKNDGTAKLYNTTITVENNAKVIFNELVVDNTNKGDDYTILLESEGNVIKNSTITIKSNTPVQAIKIEEDNNQILDTTVNVQAPSSDVIYNADYSIGNAATSGIFIRSSNNILNNITVNYNGKQQTGYFPSVDGIDIQSKAVGTPIVNNILNNTQINVNGSNYAYGINIGRTLNTTLDNIGINVTSDYYASAIQIFDTDTIKINGKVYSTATSESYGVYSTAMATGISKNINISRLDITSKSAKARAVLIEGSNNTLMADATYDVIGDNATAIITEIDFKDNIPYGTTMKNLTININGKEDYSVIEFYKCEKVSLTNCTIKSTAGSEINIIDTPKATVSNNYIIIADTYIGDSAVKTDREDSTIKNNRPTIKELLEELANLTAPKKTSIILNPITDAKYLDNITITGKLTDDKGKLMPNEEITLTLNGAKIETSTNENGMIEYATVVKKLDQNTLSANYAGSDDYLASKTKITFTVGKKDSTFIIDKLENIKYLDNVIIRGKFINTDGTALPNSNIQLTINGKTSTVKTDADGIFTTTYKATQVGENNITASYKGSTKYNGCNVSSTFTVNKKDTQLTINKISTAKYNDKITITGKFTNADGTALTNSNVKVNINGVETTVKTDASGLFSINYTAKQVGKVNVTVSYKGNAKYNGCNATTTFTVNKKNTKITINKIANTNKGKNVSVTGKFTNADGTALTNSNIVVYVNGAHHTVKTDSKGLYNYTFTANVIGVNNITVAYMGNAKYNAFNTTTTFTVKA